MKINDMLIYRDSQVSLRYGTGVVTSVSYDEYTILWSRRGPIRYKRSILDGKFEEVFQCVDERVNIPKERHLQFRTTKSKVGIPFNENYDRAKLSLLCEKLKSSGDDRADDVADGLATELITKKFVLRSSAKAVLGKLAELCDARSSAARTEARDISRELFFGYVLQKSDFRESERA